MSELNAEQIVAQRPSVQLVNQDGVTMIELVNETAETKQLATKSGPTGVTQRQWHIKNTVKQVKDGEAMTVLGDGGEAQLLTELKVTVKTYSAEAIAAKREADGLKMFASNLRKRLGLSKSKQVVADRDKLTAADVTDWRLGKRTIMGRSWDSLTDKLRKDCEKIHGEAAKEKPVKAATPTVLMQVMAEALRAEGKLDAETEAQIAQVLERQAKARKANQKPSEDVELSEQSDI